MPITPPAKEVAWLSRQKKTPTWSARRQDFSPCRVDDAWVAVGDEASRWQVHRYDLSQSFGELAELGTQFASDLASWVRARGGRDGQPFLLGPDGRPDLQINACLGSAKWRNLSERSRRSYTYSLKVWLNFLLTRGVNWWRASEDDAEEFVFWRLTDPRTLDGCRPVLSHGTWPR
jgi:Phage integrase, N-terminal SAM-like domain